MEEERKQSNFIHDIIDKELAEGINTRVQTRFPPEPNGYLHIGHAKSICLNFSTAEKYHGTCNVRFDDSNPEKEDNEYVNAILEDIKWLGYKWDHVYYASDYFDFVYECAVKLIKKGKAYVDDSTADEIRQMRGTLTEPGVNSPYRDRTVEENLSLFERMKNGEFAEGSHVLRAKIDMSSPNIVMRDPVIYRIKYVTHQRTGDKWCIYPMYDFVHPLSDAKEKVTYSLCTLEFENNREVYNWFINEIGFDEPPRQIEFARLNLNYCVTSKRRSLKLVNEGYVDGWDDPRMSTICGMRRRGYPAKAIRDFVEKVGISKANSVVDYGLLESCVRDCLNDSAPRAMAVLDPLKLVVDNFPEGKYDEFTVENHPDHPELGSRTVRFGRNLFIERSDFEVNPPKKYFRLFPGNEVRMKGAYFVKCVSYDTDENGKVTAVHCTYDPETRGGESPDGRKVKGTIHFVNADDCFAAEVRLYDRLFNVENPTDESKGDFTQNVNPDSLKVVTALIENGIKDAKPGDVFQFMRQGYFCFDKNSTCEKPIINRTVELKSKWKAK
jgi:glutaminyl-tRNA synthetase